MIFFEVTRRNVRGVYIVNIFTLLSKYLCIATFEKFGNKKDTCQFFLISLIIISNTYGKVGQGME